MYIGQADGASDDAGQGGHVGDLFDAGQEAADVSGSTRVAQLVQHEPLQRRVHVEYTLDVHVGLESLLDAPAVWRQTLQILELLVIGAHHHRDGWVG